MSYSIDYQRESAPGGAVNNGAVGGARLQTVPSPPADLPTPVQTQAEQPALPESATEATTTGEHKRGFSLRGRPQGDDVAELERMRQHAHTMLERQDDPALLEYKDLEEIEDERKAAKTRRARRRKVDSADADAELDGHEKDLKTKREIEDRKRSDQRWKAKADSAYQRATDPSARVARLHRTMTWLSRILTGCVAGGIVWGAFNVRANVAADLGLWDPRSILAFLLEPLCSVPLVLLLKAQQDCHNEGVTFAGKRWSGRWFGVFAVEIGLLAVLVGLNGKGHFGAELVDLLPWIAPPFLVSLGVLLQPFIVSRYAELIDNARAEVDTGRLEGDAERIVSAMVRIKDALRTGQLAVWENGLPSVSKAAKTLHVEKKIAQHALDGLQALQAAERG